MTHNDEQLVTRKVVKDALCRLWFARGHDGCRQFGKTRRIMSKHKYDAYAGKREVDGELIHFASRMEFNYYLYLRWLKEHGENKGFVYQPKGFDFHRRAGERPDLWKERWLPQKRSYRPDFMVTRLDGTVEYVETVGKLRRSHNKNFRLMAILFPEISLRVVTTPEYKAIEAKVGNLIEGWERGRWRNQEHRFAARSRIPHIDDVAGLRERVDREHTD